MTAEATSNTMEIDTQEQKEQQEKTWCQGTEILYRKWAKRDEIEYDSDPGNKRKDDKSHVHKGTIIKVNEGKGIYGMIMVKDDNGSYGNYGLDEINIKLPRATAENTVKRDRKTQNNLADMYSVVTTSLSNTTVTETKDVVADTTSYENLNSDIKICVIGAGVNGLCVARHLIQNNLTNVTIFEATCRIGGIWNYEPDPQYPNPMYNSLTTNIPRPSMHFPDLDFETECKEIALHHTFILKYIQYYAKQFDLIKYVKFNHKIEKVIPPNMNDKADSIESRFPQWTVNYKDILNDKIEQELFDTVVVCNGHFMKEYMPRLECEGLETTQIPYFHSRCYREPKHELFDDKIIVIVGAGYSGKDIANEIFNKCNNVTIYQVVHSIYDYGSKKNFTMKCYIKKFTERSVEFDDGVIIYPDLVIFCTGYLHDHPFLNHKEFTEHKLIKMKYGFNCNGLAINGLYKHMIYPHLPTIFFPGINHGIVPFLHAFYQALWIAKILTDLRYERKGDEIVWISKYFTNKKKMIEWMRKNRQFSGLRSQHHMTQQDSYFRYICKKIGETYPIRQGK